MKTNVAVGIALLAVGTLAGAQSRSVTLTVNAYAGAPTNSVADAAIEANELARVIWAGGNGTVSVIKNGITIDHNFTTVSPLNHTRPIAVAGPATVQLKMEPTGSRAYCTLEIVPESFPPGQTIIIPADTKGANIVMEASTNLIHWAAAAPGLYTNVPSHTFFRLRAERIP